MAMDERAMERIAESLETIADTLTQWVKLEQQKFEKQFPVRRNPLDIAVNRLPSATDLLKEDQGATGEADIDEWTGERERSVIAKQSSKTSKKR